MAETAIEWTATRLPDGTTLPGYTFNAWEGCQKIGPGCDHCYAEARNVRFTGGINWGPHAPRRRTSAARTALPACPRTSHARRTPAAATRTDKSTAATAIPRSIRSVGLAIIFISGVYGRKCCASQSSTHYKMF